MKRSGFIRRKKPMARGSSQLKRTPIRKVSEKRKRDSLAYSQRRRWFLGMPEHSACPIAAKGKIPDLNGELKPHWRCATEIHHMHGRVGRLYLAEEYWLGVSSEGHRWLHDHPAEARANGWLK